MELNVRIPTEPNRKLFSREHVLADDLSRLMREPKRFGAYLGIAKRYRERDLRALAAYVLQHDDLPADARGKYFFACLRNLKIIAVPKKKRHAKSKRNNKHTVNRKRAGAGSPKKSS